jgi:SAM-dependent methyltransferase
MNVAAPASMDSLQQRIIDEYRRLHGSADYLRANWRGYTNVGSFEDGETDQGRASEKLVERLIAPLGASKRAVLDVGCGIGGVVRTLGERFGADRIHGINICEHQLALARELAPASHFQIMPAERMSFADHSFDALVTLESMGHFQGRAEFLREAFRVLEPGGQVVAADVVFRVQPPTTNALISHQELYGTLDAYLALWRDAGFCDITCQDVTASCWLGYVANKRKRALRERATGVIDAMEFGNILRDAAALEAMSLYYVLVAARKPD